MGNDEPDYEPIYYENAPYYHNIVTIGGDSEGIMVNNIKDIWVDAVTLIYQVLGDGANAYAGCKIEHYNTEETLKAVYTTDGMSKTIAAGQIDHIGGTIGGFLFSIGDVLVASIQEGNTDSTRQVFQLIGRTTT